jgi:tetratricopeptide (TPR) repeat protein
MTPPSPLDEAVGQHQSGRLDEAEKLYNNILDSDPRNPDALHLLGVLKLQRGQLQDAQTLISRALEISPDHPFYRCNLGIALLESGAIADSIEQFSKALSIDPNYLDARYNLGNARRAQGDTAGAAEEFSRVAQAEPAHLPAANNFALCLAELGRLSEAAGVLNDIVKRAPQDLQTLTNLGKILLQLHRPDEAILHYDAALASTPDNPALLNGRAAALIEANRFDDAEAAIHAILTQNPDDQDALLNLANLQAKSGAADDAVETFLRITEIYPDHAGAWNNLGSLLWRHYRYDEALAAIERALSLRPDHPDTLDNYALALAACGQPDNAKAVFDKALEKTPGHAELTFDRSLLALARGQFGAGARDYRARSGIQHRAAALFRDRLPSDLNGRTIVVEADQGLGDELFFLRFIPQLRDRGARVHYAGDRRLIPMLQRAGIADSITALADGPPRSNDVWNVAVGDLPYALAMADTDTAPPSLVIPPLTEQTETLKHQLERFGPPPYLGVTWRAGTAGRREAIFKQVPLERFAGALRGVAGTFIALQRLPEPGEIGQFAECLEAPLHDLTALNDDLEAMLALTGLLDDYICVSNTNVHLRATQGRTCRVLVPHPPEFRWMYEGTESPWFRESCIYRQTRDGDWSPALTALHDDLASG